MNVIQLYRIIYKKSTIVIFIAGGQNYENKTDFSIAFMHCNADGAYADGYFCGFGDG